MKKLVVLLTFAISGCVSTPQVARLTPDVLSVEQTKTVQSAVTSKLKDPSSAQFGIMRAGRDRNGKLFVCGTVNAKNSFGGYTGMSPFGGDFSSDGRFLVGGIGGNPSVSTAIYQVCSQQGLNI